MPSGEGPSLFANWLGYLTIILAFGGMLLGVAATWKKQEQLSELGRYFALAVVVSVSVTTLVALSVYVVSRTSRMVYAQLFVAASLFTLALALVDWPGREEGIPWRVDTQWLYLAGHLGCFALAILLVWMG
jgi:cell division protein FtsW (lipid II flippase)